MVQTVRETVSLDCASLRRLVKRVLPRYGYPPDKQEKATQTVLEQAALLCAEWAAAREWRLPSLSTQPISPRALRRRRKTGECGSPGKNPCADASLVC
ncbi:MAG: DUF3387 domain-containing protein [Calditrichaeota bacterium]|nr:DUF3387 domain-containing protein [Calditrichota bacterium]